MSTLILSLNGALIAAPRTPAYELETAVAQTGRTADARGPDEARVIPIG